MEQFLFVLSFKVAPYFQLKKTFYLIFIRDDGIEPVVDANGVYMFFCLFFSIQEI